MADIKTILRELSVIVGIGFERYKVTSVDYTPINFVKYVKMFCTNIDEHKNELEKVIMLKSFSKSHLESIKNGVTLGQHIYQKLQSSGNIFWVGASVGMKYPFDMRIGDTGFSLKENSYILKNPAFADYLNALVQPKTPFKRVHVFREFSASEFEEWFQYTYSCLKKEVKALHPHETVFEYSKGENKYFIKRDIQDVVFGTTKDSGNVRLPLSMEISEQHFNHLIRNDIVEHTFSKWIRQNMETDEKYIHLKRVCAETAGENLRAFILSNNNPDTEKMLEIFQIYDSSYYFGRCKNMKPALYKVPVKSKCDLSISEISYLVPKSQLNVLFTFEITVTLNGGGKTNEIRMHVECRYSHGQLNGIPEAKLYCKDKLEKLYELQ